MKIISGGQTGVDRAALDTAIAKGIPYGGWCPRGGWAEDLPQPPGLLAMYPHLQETPLRDPAQRTEWNVRDADRLIILTDGAGITVSRGTEAARAFAIKLGKPSIVLNLDTNVVLDSARAFLAEGEGNVSICIAGPRESEAPGIYVKARASLRLLL
jgi:Circularly permutated YpsA SLOG family